MNHSSERWSSTGSTASSRHCSMRSVWVNVPSFSTCDAAGKKNTSVRHSSGTISPVSTSGASFQKVAVSIIARSRTTSHSSWASASRISRPFDTATAGFWPQHEVAGDLAVDHVHRRPVDAVVAVDAREVVEAVIVLGGGAARPSTP